MKDLKICICGGGSIGHVVAGVLSSKGLKVSLLTGHPDQWKKEIKTLLPDGKYVNSHLEQISSDPSQVITKADYILLCLPGFLISDTLTRIKPFLKKGAVVGSMVSSNGFFWMAKEVLSSDNPYFGLQRVPFIARTIDYGYAVELKGYKTLLKVAVSPTGNKDQIVADLTSFFDTPIALLSSFWPAALTNSNPILHTARLFSLFRDHEEGMVYSEEPLFYESWDDTSSDVLIACDHEFQQIISQLPFDKQEIPPLLTYYESFDASTLTNKIRSITAFKNIRLNMNKTNAGFVPDWNNRYFSEDIPYGLLIIKAIALLVNVPTPQIDEVIFWAQKNMKKEYLIDEKSFGKDIKETGIPQNFITSSDNIVEQLQKGW